MTQGEMILRHMRDNGSISSAEAFTEYGIMRLAARIYDLRRQGYCIKGQQEERTNRFGKKIWFDRYTLIE